VTGPGSSSRISGPGPIHSKRKFIKCRAYYLEAGLCTLRILTRAQLYNKVTDVGTVRKCTPEERKDLM
jgi:hypothetical protein